MRKLSLFLIVLSLLLSGCGKKPEAAENPGAQSTTPIPAESSASSETDSESPSPTADETILNAFREQSLAKAPADQLFASLEEGIVKVPPEQADEFIRILDAYYVTDLHVTEAKFESPEAQEAISAMGYPYRAENVGKIEDESVRKAVETAYNGGYKLETTEGYIFPLVDYSRLLAFSDRLSIPMKAYVDLMAMESDAMSASDGGIVIGLDELARRTLAAESYAVTFPDSPERGKAEDRFVSYLSMYLIGLNNTPIFDFETYVLLPETKAQFEQMAAAHGDTITGKLTKKLLDILNKSGGAVFEKDKDGNQADIPESKAFRDTLETEARAMLPAR